MNWEKKYRWYGVFGFFGGILGGAFCMSIKHAKNMGTLADWLSALGTIAAVMVALWPQIKSMFGSNLFFQLELNSSEKIYKFNILNLSDANEIVDIKYINHQLIELNYQKNEEVDVEKNSVLIKNSDSISDSNTNKGEPNKVFKRYPIHDIKNKFDPVLIKASDSISVFKNNVVEPKYVTKKYVDGSIYATVIQANLITQRNSDNYLFYGIIIAYKNNLEIYKTNIEKNVSEKKFKSKIIKEINAIPSFVSKK